MARKLNLSKSDIFVPALRVSVADNARLELMGAQFFTLSAAGGQTTEQLVYFAKGVGEFYLSKSALIDLGVIAHNFPSMGSCSTSNNSQACAIYEVQDGFPSVRQHHKQQDEQRLRHHTPLYPGLPPKSYSTPCSLKVPQLMPLFIWSLANDKARPHPPAYLFVTPPASHRVQPQWERVCPNTL